MGTKLIITVGLISILISVTTWALDLTGLVEECIYCRSERTIIGILGIIILMPHVKFFKLYVGAVFGFLGANIASDQIFLNIKNNHFALMFVLASCALFILIAQVWFLHYVEVRSAKELEKKESSNQ
ncbi:MAG: hypothetical protein H0U71_06610 [Gammaproteobacteria bacterium]|nr:hypothetical protein [Gammaproteobacteria bacterium]